MCLREGAGDTVVVGYVWETGSGLIGVDAKWAWCNLDEHRGDRALLLPSRQRTVFTKIQRSRSEQLFGHRHHIGDFETT